MIIVFEITGKVVAKGRGKVGKLADGRITVFTPAHTRKYESVVRLAAAQAMGDRDPIEGPVEVFVHVYLDFPKSASKKKITDMGLGRIFPTTKPDIDNYVKSALDGINTIVIKDDNQVVRLHAYKLFRSKPALRIEVREIGNKVTKISLEDVI